MPPMTASSRPGPSAPTPFHPSITGEEPFMTAVPFVRPTRAPRAKLPPEEPLIPQRGRGSKGGYWLYLLPGLVLVTAVVIIPLVWNLYLTFTEYRGIRPPEWIGLENWTKLLQDEKFWTSFR